MMSYMNREQRKTGILGVFYSQTFSGGSCTKTMTAVLEGSHHSEAAVVSPHTSKCLQKVQERRPTLSVPLTDALGLGTSQKVKPNHIYCPLVVCCSTNKSQDPEISFSLVLFDLIPVTVQS